MSPSPLSIGTSTEKWASVACGVDPTSSRARSALQPSMTPLTAPRAHSSDQSAGTNVSQLFKSCYNRRPQRRALESRIQGPESSVLHYPVCDFLSLSSQPPVKVGSVLSLCTRAHTNIHRKKKHREHSTIDFRRFPCVTTHLLLRCTGRLLIRK